jgi:hypothetical protein
LKKVKENFNRDEIDFDTFGRIIAIILEDASFIKNDNDIENENYNDENGENDNELDYIGERQ